MTRQISCLVRFGRFFTEAKIRAVSQKGLLGQSFVRRSDFLEVELASFDLGVRVGQYVSTRVKPFLDALRSDGLTKLTLSELLESGRRVRAAYDGEPNSLDVLFYATHYKAFASQKTWEKEMGSVLEIFTAKQLKTRFALENAIEGGRLACMDGLTFGARYPDLAAGLRVAQSEQRLATVPRDLAAFARKHCPALLPALKGLPSYT